MRRHFLFAREDAAEPSVGDATSDKSLLRLWLERREAITLEPSVSSHLVFFWDLAKLPERGVLLQDEYVQFFARVAVALIDSIRTSQVADQVAQRDWVYDSHGDVCKYGADSSSVQQSYLSFELFREALMEIAELLLPVESDASVFASFFLELRECIAFPPGLTASTDDAPPSALSLEAAVYALREVRGVQKIRGAFLQSGPPSRDRLADIAGLPPPDSRRMSLKQLLLCYNPRKLTLSRAFSTLARLEHDRVDGIDTIDEVEPDQGGSDVEINSSDIEPLNIPLSSVRHLNCESNDAWDSEIAFIQSLETAPAPRIAIIGAPFSGKTRFAKLLAKKMRLRYLSCENSVQMAVDTLQQRRQRKRSKDVEMASSNPDAEDETETADANDGTNPVDIAESEIPPPSNVNIVSSDLLEPDQDPLLDVFTDKDLNTLLAGLTLPREKAISLLIHFATSSLLAGVGVMLDDVYPHELRGEIGIDFLVSLHSTKNDLRMRASGLHCDPIARNFYSERELSLLRLTNAKKSEGAPDPLVHLGFADAFDDEDSEDKNRVDKNIKSLKISLPAETLEGDQSDGAEISDEKQTSPRPDEESETTCSNSGIINNDITALTETTVPLRTLNAEFFNARYRQYRERVKTCETHNFETKWDVIPVLATQSLAAGVRQCVEIICGNDLGVSRLNTSRRATPINLPDTLSPSDTGTEEKVSRAEQMRCLLFGNWTDAIDRANDEVNGESLPLSLSGEETESSTSAIRWRRLSRWREFCPVTSSAEQRLVLGSPLFAAILAGRIYLFASAITREAFCAHPLQYLRRDPATFLSFPSKMWVLHRRTGERYVRLLTELELALSLTRISAIETLKDSALPNEIHRGLTSGHTVPAKEAAQVVCSKIASDGCEKWILHDLLLTADTVAELQTNNCLPDLIIALDEPNESEETEGQDSMTLLRSKTFSVQLENAEQVLAPLGLSLKRCKIPNIAGDEDIEDALAVIHANINPLYPCTDNTADGYVPTDQLNSSIPPAGSNDESTATLLSTMISPSSAFMPISSLLGDTHRFCAVSWKKRGALIPGLPDFVSCFRQRVYTFSGAAEQVAFERNPLRYIPSTPSEVSSLVPLVILVGVRGVATRKVIEALVSTTAPSGGKYSVLTVDTTAIQRTLNRKRKLLAIKSESETEEDPDGDAKITIEALCENIEATKCSWRQTMGAEKRSAVMCLPGIPTETNTSSSASDDRTSASGAAAEDPDSGNENDFPVLTQNLLDAMLAVGMFPALVIPFEASEGMVVHRRVASWFQREKEVREKKAQLKAATKRKPKATSSQVEEENEGDSEEEATDLEVLQAEYTEKMTNEFAADQEALTILLDTLLSRGVEVSDSIDADGSMRQRIKHVEMAISNFVARKDSLFSPCYIPSPTKVSRNQQRPHERMILARLASGELAVGKHGTRCPVGGPQVLARVRTCEDLLAQAVVYRDRIYFPGNLGALKVFQTRPWEFVSAPLIPPPHPLVCTVVGAPHTPTARLACCLARATGSIHVSPQSAISWASQCLGGTVLWQKLAAMKQAGVNATQDISVVRAAIFARLQSAECLSHGWILDDYILTPGEIERLDTDGDSSRILEVRVESGLLLVVDDSFQSVCTRQQLNLAVPVPSTAMNELVARERLAGQFSAWQCRRLGLISKWLSIYGDPLVQSLPVQSSSCNNGFWNLLERAQTYLERHNEVLRRHRLLQTSKDVQRPTCSIRGVPRSSAALTARAHPVIGTFCPVELREGRYVAVPPSSREFCLDYGTYSFWLLNEANIQKFCEDPKRYVDAEAVDHANELLAKAPVESSVLSLISVGDCDFPELKGYCPVTFATFAAEGNGSSNDGAQANWRAIVKGSVFFRATYERKVYVMASETARRQFIYDPTRFIGLKLPVKLPPQVTVALSTNYPGRLEQILSTILQDSLLTLGSCRPKFPGATTAASACVFLALILQQHGREVARKKHLEADHDHEQDSTDIGDGEDDAVLSAYERDCQLAVTLRRAITPSSPSCGPAIRGVRGLLSSLSTASLQVLEPQNGEDITTGQTPEEFLEEAQLRFDAIAKCEETARYVFLEYATSAGARKRRQFGLK